MKLTRKSLHVFQFIFISFFLISICKAKSLYVIDHSSKLIAFEIVDNTLVFQKKIQLKNWGYGGIDLTIDDDSDILFATFERGFGDGGNVIELIVAKNLESIGTIELEGPSGLNITGLAYDHSRNKLYGTDRNSNDLYVYDWNPVAKTLTADPNNTQIALTGTNLT